MCITESLLYSRDCHSIVNQLYFNNNKNNLFLGSELEQLPMCKGTCTV